MCSVCSSGYFEDGPNACGDCSEGLGSNFWLVLLAVSCMLVGVLLAVACRHSHSVHFAPFAFFPWDLGLPAMLLLCKLELLT